MFLVRIIIIGTFCGKIYEIDLMDRINQKLCSRFPVTSATSDSEHSDSENGILCIIKQYLVFSKRSFRIWILQIKYRYSIRPNCTSYLTYLWHTSVSSQNVLWRKTNFLHNYRCLCVKNVMRDILIINTSKITYNVTSWRYGTCFYVENYQLISLK